MSKKCDLWMPIYIADYLGDTTHLTTAQHGAYLLLLMTCWKRGAVLPDDDEKLAQIARCDARTWKTIRPVVEEFFDIEGGEWTQKRLTAEFKKAGGISAARREAGKAGAAKRWGNGGGDDGKPIANAMANGQQDASQPPSQIDTPSPSPLPKAKPKPPDGESEDKARPEADDAPPLSLAALKTGSISSFQRPLPEGWEPSPETVARVIRARPDLADRVLAMAEDFRLYLATKGGIAALSADWESSFIRWASKERETPPSRGRKQVRLPGGFVC